MRAISEPWFYYVIAGVTGLLLLNLAITGSLFSKYGPILIVRSVPLRIAFFLISVVIFTLIVWVTKQQIAAALQYFDQPS